MNDVKEVFVQVRSPKGGALDGVSSRMFLNLRRTNASCIVRFFLHSMETLHVKMECPQKSQGSSGSKSTDQRERDTILARYAKGNMVA